MPFVLSIKDTYRQAVESATGGKNTVMYDDKGNPSIMVCIPKFNLSDVIAGAPNTPHPAFIVNGVVKSEIWISKYQNIVHDGRAYSLPFQDPTYVTYDQAKQYCAAKGPGWHLMTNAEWAAIALWCKKNGFMPRGNNNYGKDHSATHERGKVTYQSGGQDARVATGSGPASWAHNGMNDGIFDLNGNVWEWVDGLKLIDGKIYVHQDNNYNTPEGPRVVDQWVDTGVYFDNTTAGNANTTSSDIGGDPVLGAERTNPMYTGDASTDPYYGYSQTTFEALAAKSGFTVPDLLKYLAIAPIDANHGGDGIWVRNYGERVATRGGSWSNGSLAGVFALGLDDARSNSAHASGFRSAYIAP
ncbi:SUMF1/EgtB/PvdO family nonheme iron enzyme [Geobacillus stearothermophilus]|uniref:SUMF1/EgtB/PvdO family nonheme iron enzyme n=1 Tax=Geobacillus stearothermophilus TaxID=1422 RepID=UPI002E24B9B3|nr:SUMF1/EgtB/PvdO family nonheme iron enzyme [Geobacillus stearothermophilus]